MAYAMGFLFTDLFNAFAENSGCSLTPAIPLQQNIG
jgi:hypothetical protein